MKKIINLLILMVFIYATVNAQDCSDAAYKTRLVQREIKSNYDYSFRSEVTVDDLGVGNYDTFEKYFYSDNKYAIIVLGADGADFDLYVYDENGNLINKDTSDNSYSVVEFTPSWSGKFYIKVKLYKATIQRECYIISYAYK